eukprot:Amastigsp_a179063_7.p2 type:complete len:214 gc:universal Amastigsp_a179063_7:1298-657(-)
MAASLQSASPSHHLDDLRQRCPLRRNDVCDVFHDEALVSRLGGVCGHNGDHDGLRVSHSDGLHRARRSDRALLCRYLFHVLHAHSRPDNHPAEFVPRVPQRAAQRRLVGRRPRACRPPRRRHPLGSPSHCHLAGALRRGRCPNGAHRGLVVPGWALLHGHGVHHGGIRAAGRAGARPGQSDRSGVHCRGAEHDGQDLLHHGRNGHVQGRGGAR